MQQLAELYIRMENNSDASHRIALLCDYFSKISKPDLIWSVFLLSGRRLNVQLKPAQLRRWVQEYIEIDDWLFDECYAEVGDLCETIALLFQQELNATSTRE